MLAALLLVLEVFAICGDLAAARFATTLPAGQVHAWNVVTAFGTSGYMFATSAAVALAAVAWRRHVGDPAVRVRLSGVAERACFFFACIALSGIAAQTIKHAVGRMRPKYLAQGGAYDFLGPSFHRGADSFPSGHTTSAFAAALALGLISPRLRVPAATAAVLIGFSRIATGNHFPSDVVFGAALGSTVSLAIAMWLARHGLVFEVANASGTAGRS